MKNRLSVQSRQILLKSQQQRRISSSSHIWTGIHQHFPRRYHSLRRAANNVAVDASTCSATLIGCIAAAIASVKTKAITSSCEDSSPPLSLPLESPSKLERAAKDGLQVKRLWPGGVDEQSLLYLVQVILEDPSINILLIPDRIEAAIYKSAIRLVLNLIYRWLSRLDGVSLLSHRIQVVAVANTNVDNNNRIISMTRKIESVDDQVLETIAKRLLEQKAINNAVIPDDIEIQLYKNCLKVIFRVLEIVSNSFSINICGHDIQLTVSPSMLEKSALAVSAGSSSSLAPSEINMEILESFALDAGVSRDGSDELSFWDRLLFRRKLVANLHASLYGLILGILDDILQNSKIKILSDDIYFDVVQGSTDETVANKKKDVIQPATRKETSNSLLPPFTGGFLVGVGLMTIIFSRR